MLEFTPHPDVKKIWCTGWFVWFVVFYVLPMVLISIFKTEPVSGDNIAMVVITVVLVPVSIFSLIWIFLYYKTLKYQVTDEYISIDSGVWWKKVKTIPFQKITNINTVQGPRNKFGSQ